MNAHSAALLFPAWSQPGIGTENGLPDSFILQGARGAELTLLALEERVVKLPNGLSGAGYNAIVPTG